MHKEGKLLEFGLSNFAPWEVMEIYYITKEHGWIQPTVYQGMYNAVTRATEELFPVLRKCGMRFYAFNLLAGGLLTDKRAAAVTDMQPSATDGSGAEIASDPPRDGGRFDPAQAGPMKIGHEYTARYWRPAYLSALRNLHSACQSCDGGPIAVQDAAHRWLMHHSLLDAAKGDGVILGASSEAQLEENLNACVGAGSGPLRDAVVAAFEAAWELTAATCPTYYSGYSGMNVFTTTHSRHHAKL
jgi:aflatoxin B1 aldehyde reductase